MSRDKFIRQIVTWFGECADGYIAPQLAYEVTQRTHEDFMTAVVTASLLLIPDSVDSVNRVACFCNGHVFDTLILRIDPKQFKEQLSTAVQQAFLDATWMFPQSPFEKRWTALFSQVQVDDVGADLISPLALTTVSRAEWKLIATWMNFPHIPPEV